ncbi:MAG: hypothetical protein FWH41_09765 [Treponema sp.]|nr:hypothetical protein [Treponema sp.]
MLKNKNKMLISFVFLLLFLQIRPLVVFAQQGPNPRDFWHVFERGKLMFRQGDYSGAFNAFEDAKRQKFLFFERLEKDLIDLLSISEVRRMGDALDWVERFIQERHYAGAADALEELYYRIPKEKFNNSAKAALAALGSLKEFPEAERCLGDVYLIEGELDLALRQFQKALALNNSGDAPDMETELLYKIAEIRRTRQEYNEMERTLLAILKKDRLWSSIAEKVNNNEVPFILQAMNRTLINNGINQFITQYRYKNDESAEAHRLLGFYYCLSGRPRAQEHLMFAFLIQNTVIIEELTLQRFDFTYTRHDALIAEINRSPLLSDYAAKNEYFKTAYYLGASLYGNGNTASAREIWNFLSTFSAAGEWRNRAIAQLRSPHNERNVEMP